MRHRRENRCEDLECYRDKDGSDNLCRYHRAGARAKVRNAEKRQAALAATLKRHEREDNRYAYVQAWRGQHESEVYSVPWICPLCCQAVQITRNLISRQGALLTAARVHQQAHGTDWDAYVASYKTEEAS